jgi:hypothetical protein
MAKLRKMVTYTDYRWEETEELTPEQLKSGNQAMKIYKKKFWTKLSLIYHGINVLKTMEKSN